jgi:hypothetical protein
MNNRFAKSNHREPLEELSPRLRRIVEGIVQEMPPEQLTRRTLQGVRRKTVKAADDRPRPLEHRRQRRAIGRSFAAATAISVTVCTLMLFAASLFVSRTPRPEVAPPVQGAVSLDLPTAWAYHKAMSQSPEAVDVLLARHAEQVLRPEPHPLQAHAFPLSP